MGKNFIISDLSIRVPLKQKHLCTLIELSKVHRIGVEMELMYFPYTGKNTGSGSCKMPQTNIWMRNGKETEKKGNIETGKCAGTGGKAFDLLWVFFDLFLKSIHLLWVCKQLQREMQVEMGDDSLLAAWTAISSLTSCTFSWTEHLLISSHVADEFQKCTISANTSARAAPQQW